MRIALGTSLCPSIFEFPHKTEVTISTPSGIDSASEILPARNLCECPHRHMDSEKGKDSADQADNSDNVVTKVTSVGETQDAIVYPNVFWTSCVSFGVALGLFLVSNSEFVLSFSPCDANHTISGWLGHGECGRIILIWMHWLRS